MTVRGPVDPDDLRAADDLGVQCGAALSDAAHRVDEDGHVAHPLLEEVAHAFGMVADQVDRV